jgi:hypothetical protein
MGDRLRVFLTRDQDKTLLDISEKQINRPKRI